MTIKEIEAKTGMRRANIRFYERAGLLAPERRAENDYREYGEREVDCLKKIRFLRLLGFSVEEIRQLQRGELDMGAALAERRAILQKQQEENELLEHLCGQMEGVRSFEEFPVNRWEEEETFWENGGKERMDREEETKDRYETAVMAGFLIAVVFLIGSLLLWPFVFDYADAGVKAPVFLDGAVLLFASVGMMVFLRFARGFKRGRFLVWLLMAVFVIYGIAVCVGVPVYYKTVGPF